MRKKMPKKKLGKKLVLDKETISKLQDEEMKQIKGASVILLSHCCDPTESCSVMLPCCGPTKDN